MSTSKGSKAKSGATGTSPVKSEKAQSGGIKFDPPTASGAKKKGKGGGSSGGIKFSPPKPS